MVHRGAGGAGWVPPVLTCSAREGTGVAEVWSAVLDHRQHLGPEGLAEKRAAQQLDFMWALVHDELAQRLKASTGVSAIREELRAEVLSGRLPATSAADRILAAYDAPGDRPPTTT